MEKKKETKSMTIIVIILMIMVLGLGGYITYDKVLSNKDTEKSNKEQKLEVTEDEATQVMKKFLLVNDNGNECPSATSEIAANSNGKISNEDLFYSVGFYIELSNVTFTSGTSGKNMCTTEVINEMVKENILADFTKLTDNELFVATGGDSCGCSREKYNHYSVENNQLLIYMDYYDGSDSELCSELKEAVSIKYTFEKEDSNWILSSVEKA